MKYIVKITTYKHRTSINIPVDLVRKIKLRGYKHVEVWEAGDGTIRIKGYKDDENPK
ncbi:hypothetical protein LCGC14_1053440 [marine sediment metagenome]|uniref:SpoVT-AbrB domain-containing protein n=1 Tax=marine sediment metagenome TaxID=412755 RepID=A0A0F9Q679_9ZZZZ